MALPVSLSLDSSPALKLHAVTEVASYPCIWGHDRADRTSNSQGAWGQDEGQGCGHLSKDQVPDPRSGALSTHRAGSLVTKQDICPFTGIQETPRTGSLSPVPWYKAEGGGAVCLKGEKSTDGEFQLWIDWTFIKRETVLCHRVT